MDQAPYDKLSNLAVIDEALCATRYHKSYPSGCHTANRMGDIHLPLVSMDVVMLMVKCMVEYLYGHDRLWETLNKFRSLPKLSSKPESENATRNKNLHQRLCDYWSAVRVQTMKGLVKMGD